MSLETLPLALLIGTLAFQCAHVAMHVWARHGPPYGAWARDDAAVGYMGALLWFALVVATRSTIALAPWAGAALGLPLVVLGLCVHGAGIRDLRRYRDGPSLVVQGIYRRLRHPIYYGWALVSFGMPLPLLSWTGLVTAPLWSILVLLIARLEEAGLRRGLPPGEYDAYARTTWL